MNYQNNELQISKRNDTGKVLVEFDLSGAFEPTVMRSASFLGQRF